MKRQFFVMALAILLGGCAASVPQRTFDQHVADQSHQDYCLEQELDSVKSALSSLNDSVSALARICLLTDSLAKENESRFKEYRLNAFVHAIPESVIFCGQSIVFDTPDKWSRLERALVNIAESQIWLRSTYQRAKLSFPVIDSIMADSLLPFDLRYVPAIESGYDNQALSHAGASGPWQFMPVTGRRFQLTQNAWVDMRHNLIGSTQAAAGYLYELHCQFGNWPLALAAYNMGEGGLARRIKEQGVEDYFDLLLPSETEMFVFKIIAIKFIFENPEQFNIPREIKPDWEYVQSDTVSVQIRSSLSIYTVAEWCIAAPRQIKLLNPELKNDTWGPGQYVINLPRNTRHLFVEAMAELKAGKR